MTIYGNPLLAGVWSYYDNAVHFTILSNSANEEEVEKKLRDEDLNYSKSAQGEYCIYAFNGTLSDVTKVTNKYGITIIRDSRNGTIERVGNKSQFTTEPEQADVARLTNRQSTIVDKLAEGFGWFFGRRS